MGGEEGGGEQLGGRGEEIRLSSAAQRERKSVCVFWGSTGAKFLAVITEWIKYPQ